MSDYDMTADYIESDQPPRTIFAVASGEYSDYQIHFMCESEADAKEIASKLAKRPYSDGYVIESYPMFPQGANLKQRPQYSATGTLGTMNVEVKEEWTTYGHFGPRPQVNVLDHMNMVRAEGGDCDACIKAVKDRLAAHLAQQ